MNPLAYQPRQVEALGTLSLSGRQLKLYGLFAHGRDRRAVPARATLQEHLAPLVAVPAEQNDHRLGYVILHLALDGDYLLISHWMDANMLRHQVYRCKADAHGVQECVSLAPSGIIACVWELDIMKFERDAWVRTVLAQGRLDASATDAYLGARFSGWV